MDETYGRAGERGVARRSGRRHRTPAVPAFFLYGEAPRAVEAEFLHLENLDKRSRPSDWNIRPHAHAGLAHIFVISAGAGIMAADGVEHRFVAPALLIVPAMVVHAFTWQPDTQGRVLTIAAAYLARLLGSLRELPSLFERAVPIGLEHGSAEVAAIDAALDRMMREHRWRSTGCVQALDACMTLLLLDALRLHQAQGAAEPVPARAGVRLVGRFVDAVEADFRRQKRVRDYADALGTGPAALRAATKAATGRAPSAMLRDRMIVEAKRLLLYSNIRVAEAAYELGFDDPAYFSRVFRAAVGVSPRAFRQGSTAGGG